MADDPAHMTTTEPLTLECRDTPGDSILIDGMAHNCAGVWIMTSTDAGDCLSVVLDLDQARQMRAKLTEIIGDA